MDGWVVCKEHAAVLLSAWKEEQVRKEQASKEVRLHEKLCALQLPMFLITFSEEAAESAHQLETNDQRPLDHAKDAKKVQSRAGTVGLGFLDAVFRHIFPLAGVFEAEE